MNVHRSATAPATMAASLVGMAIALPCHEVTLELRGSDVASEAFLRGMDAPERAWLAESATIVRDARHQVGIFEAAAPSYADAVSLVTAELAAIAPELEATPVR